MDIIKDALHNFRNAPLRDGTIKLLNAFGLASEREFPVTDGSLVGFFQQFPVVRGKLIDEEVHRISKFIHKIVPLFQITAEEIGLLPAFGEGGRVVAHSIIFIAADIHHISKLTQDELNTVIRVLNKGSGIPVIGVFRYGKYVAFGAMGHRINKIQSEKNVLFTGGVTTDVNLRKPNFRHQNFLLRWRTIITSGTDNMGDVVMHLASVPSDYQVNWLCEQSSAPDILHTYIHEISCWPLLTKMQEQELGRDGSHVAKEKLIYSNLRLVIWVVKKYSWKSKLDILDLIQAGNIGLMKAAEKYNYRLGYKFSTYATWWIRQSIARTIHNESRTIRVPVHRHDGAYKLNRVARQILEKTGYDASNRQLAEKLKWTEEKVRKSKEIDEDFLGSEISIDEKIISDQLVLQVDESAPTLEDISDYIGLKSVLEKILKEKDTRGNRVFQEREVEILKMRFGIDLDTDHTLEEIGAQFGVTRERIRQIEVKTLQKLKSSNRAAKLRSFY